MAQTFTPCPSCDRINRVSLDAAASKTPVCGHCKAELKLHGAISEVSGSGLRALIEKSPLPVVVDFWAPWCGPCRVFAPTFEQAATRRAGQEVFAKVDTQAYPLAADAYHIRGIPTLAIFNGGVELARTSGALPVDSFLHWVEGNLRKAA